MPALNGLTIANFPSDILWDAGVVFLASTKLGVTKGPPKFSPNRSFDNIQFDGKQAPAKGLDRLMHGEATLSFTMMEIGNASSGAQVAQMEPGSSSATVSTTTTITPLAGGGIFPAGSYITDARVLWERGGANSGNYFAVYFPYALFTKYEIAGQDKKEGLMAVELAGRIDPASGLTQATYKLEYRTTLP